MKLSESICFFEVSNGPQLDNSFRSRYLCVKDFLKKVILFPFALLSKASKTILRGTLLAWAMALLLITIGTSATVRQFFPERISSFAKDIADWILFPFAVVSRFARLLLAFLIHPNFYFNALV